MTQAQAEEVLQLPERYGKAELRRQFKAFAQEYHPDNAARNGISEKFAQTRMTEVNKAYATLKPLVDAAGPRVSIHRDLVGGSRGHNGVGVHHNPDGSASVRTQVDDSLFWDEEGNPRSAVAESEANAAADAPGHALRRFLLGPWFLRLILVALFALVWWLNFPLLPRNAARFDMSATASLSSWASVVASAVYPSYLLLFELFAGHISGALREVLNGIVSNLTRVHVEVRRKGSYQSSVSSLLEKQVYGILELPVSLALLARGLAEADAGWHLAYLVLAGIFLVDLLIGFFGAGIANGLARWLAERAEKRYVTLRMDMLKRCGQWAGGRHARS